MLIVPMGLLRHLRDSFVTTTVFGFKHTQGCSLTAVSRLLLITKPVRYNEECYFV